MSLPNNRQDAGRYVRRFGFSQEQLAERLNVSRRAITKWETNKGIACAGSIGTMQ